MRSSFGWGGGFQNCTGSRSWGVRLQCNSLAEADVLDVLLVGAVAGLGGGLEGEAQGLDREVAHGVELHGLDAEVVGEVVEVAVGEVQVEVADGVLAGVDGIQVDGHESSPWLMGPDYVRGPRAWRWG